MKALPIALCIALLPQVASAQPRQGEEVIEPSAKQLRQLQALTPESVAKKVAVNDDDLEPTATLTTEPVLKSKGRFTDKVRADNFLRAFIDKSSGTVRFQLYQEVTYSGDWRRFTTATYMTKAGPVASEIAPIARDVVTCAYGLCVYREVVGFDVPREVLEEVASGVPGTSPFWRFRFKGQSGLEWEDRLAPAEAAGLLLAVDTYLARIG